MLSDSAGLHRFVQPNGSKLWRFRYHFGGRDNMPFGMIGEGEFGTYFIGCSRSPPRIERMLDNMFVADPPGNYDRLLDFSHATTGSLFFVPPATFLGDVGPAAQSSATPSPT